MHFFSNLNFFLHNLCGWHGCNNLYKKKLMCLYCKVRVSDFKETRETTSTEYELSVLNRKDQASLDIIQKEVDPDKQDYALNQAVKLEGNGVLRSKQGTEESSMVGSQDALGQKNLVDEEP